MASPVDVQDTIVALSSPPGPGARAVIRLSGPDALPVAAAVITLSSPGPDAPPPVVRELPRGWYPGQARLPGTASPLPVDLYVWRAPRTYTGQDVVELHTLSAPPLVDLLVVQLLDAGARAARPGEFTMRAFLAGKLDLTRAEAVDGIVAAGSRDELKQALAQLAGGMSRPLQELRGDLLDLLAEVEAGLDFAEEDIRFVEPEELLHRLAKGLAQVTLLLKQFDQRAVAGPKFRAVLAGRPNAGKSSLFNALTRSSAALVSPQPGTTRDYLVRTLDAEGIPVELVDTAGLASAGDEIEGQAQALGREQAERGHLVVLCLEAGRDATAREKELLGQENPPVLAVATKCDLAAPRTAGLATSAITGAGLAELRSLLAERARAYRRPALAPSLSRCRHHVAACLGHLRQAHAAVLHEEPPEILAVELRGALDELGEMVGAVYTDDLLDRIFSRFCIGK
jgi:tRNA modification GTPase